MRSLLAMLFAIVSSTCSASDTTRTRRPVINEIDVSISGALRHFQRIEDQRQLRLGIGRSIAKEGRTWFYTGIHGQYAVFERERERLISYGEWNGVSYTVLSASISIGIRTHLGRHRNLILLQGIYYDAPFYQERTGTFNCSSLRYYSCEDAKQYDVDVAARAYAGNVGMNLGIGGKFPVSVNEIILKMEAQVAAPSVSGKSPRPLYNHWFRFTVGYRFGGGLGWTPPAPIVLPDYYNT